MDKTVN